MMGAWQGSSEIRTTSFASPSGGRLGRAWRETAEEDANHETLIRDLMDDQYTHPARIVAFNTAEGWSRDVTKDIADELRRCFAEYEEVPVSVEEFLEMTSC